MSGHEAWPEEWPEHLGWPDASSGQLKKASKAKCGRKRRQSESDPWHDLWPDPSWPGETEPTVPEDDGWPQVVETNVKKPRAQAKKKASSGGVINLSFQAGSIGDVLTSQKGQTVPDDKFSKMGRDPDVIRGRLQTGYCKCQGHMSACHSKVAEKAMINTSKAYWELPRDIQSHLLRALRSAARRSDVSPKAGSSSDSDEAEVGIVSRSERFLWSLAGQRVCFNNFVHLLGTSSPTVRKQLQGLPDGRQQPRNGGLSTQSRCVDFFFYELYHSAAEPLPIQPRPNHQAKKGAPLDKHDSDIWFEGQPWLSEGDTLAGPLDAQSPSTSSHNSHAEDWNPDAPSVTSLTAFTIAASAVVVGLPHRYIQNIRLHDLYWLFMSSWDCLLAKSSDVLDVCPSYTLFRKRWQIWKKY